MHIKKNLVISIILLAIIAVINSINSFINAPIEIKNTYTTILFTIGTCIGLMFYYGLYFYGIKKKGTKFLTFSIVLSVISLLIAPIYIVKFKHLYQGITLYLSILTYIIQIYFIIFAIKQRKLNLEYKK